MKYEAVIFDLDGTLVEFRYRFREAKTSLLESLARIGITLPHEICERPTQDLIDEAEIAVMRNPKALEFVEVRRMINDILDGFELEAFTNTKLHPEAHSVLHNLRKKEYRLGLVTNDGRKPTAYALRKFKLERFFDVVVTRDDVPKLKPSPDGVKKALSILRVEPQKAVFVGDSIIDLEAGRQAGVTVIAYTMGLYSGERLAQLHPNAIITNLNELFRII